MSLLFGLVNALIGTLLRLISLPLTLMTFGLFGLVINGVLLAITAGLTDMLDVGGFFATILAAVVISIVTAALLFVVGRMFGEPETAKAAPSCVGGNRQGTTGTVCSASSSATSSGSAARTASTRSTTAVTSTNVNAVPPVGWSCAR